MGYRVAVTTGDRGRPRGRSAPTSSCTCTPTSARTPSCSTASSTTTSGGASRPCSGPTGSGPALALAVLSTLSPAALSTAVLEDDVETLCAVPGVGRKTAARLLIDLKSRLDLPDLSGTGPWSGDGGRSPRAETRAALAELGYGPDEIRGAIEGLRRRPRRRRAAAAGPARAGGAMSASGRAARCWPGRREDGVRRDGRTRRRRTGRGGRGGRTPAPHARGVRRPGPAGRAPRHRAAGGPASPPAGRPPALRRAPGAGEDLAGRHRGRRDGRRTAGHLGPGAGPGRRPGGPADRSPGGRRPVHRRDPSAPPVGGRGPLPGHGGRQARHPDRQGPDGPVDPPRPAPLHPGRGDHPHRAGGRAAA